MLTGYELGKSYSYARVKAHALAVSQCDLKRLNISPISMAESPMSLSGLSLWLSDDDICSEPLPRLPRPPAPSRKPTKSLNHFISSGC